MDENKEMHADIEDVNAADMNEQEVVEEILEAEIVVEEDEATKYKQQATENLDKYQRCLAEFDNFRKRSAKEKATMYDEGVKHTVEKILSVIDNLERAVMAQAGKADENDAFFKGVEMTLKQFQEILTALGVTAIPAVGQTFDPNLHAAVAHEEDENYGEQEIMLEMLKGYQYKEKVIRHSMVKVAN